LSHYEIDFDQLINGIKQFSSSLICLSLNLIYLSLEDLDEIPFNNNKLQKFLESMIQLKQFHLYAKLAYNAIDNDMILSKFKNQYWFDHNLSFGMHKNYFYTFPFHFDYLYQFYQDFHYVKSNNPEILINNPRIWYNVKSIELLGTSEFDRNFVKDLKMKMPKLNLIKFNDFSPVPKHKKQILSEINDKQEKIDVTLDNVTIIEFGSAFRSNGNEKNWLINATPNLKQLILSNLKLFPISNELGKIFEKKIQRLDIDDNCDVANLTQRIYVYFSNVQYINFCFIRNFEGPQWYAKIIMRILNNLKNLKILTIYTRHRNIYSTITELKVIRYLDMNEITKTYQVKNFEKYSLFIRKIF
jgi:hypothetical protein